MPRPFLPAALVLFLCAAAASLFGQTDPYPDPAFGQQGQAIFNLISTQDRAQDIAVHPDGSFSVVGHSTRLGLPAMLALRYRPDGQPDSSFFHRGIQSMKSSQGESRALAQCLYPDGRVLIAGYAVLDTLSGKKSFRLCRLQKDGRLDTSFNGIGRLNLDFSDLRSTATAVQRLPDGKILVAGFGETLSDTNFMLLARLHDNGQIDSAFGSDGRIITALGAYSSQAFALEIQSDAKILVGGVSSNEFTIEPLVARYLPDGLPDSTFSDDGYLFPPGFGGFSVVTAMHLQSDGDLIIGGRRIGAELEMIVGRLKADGTEDPGFGYNGTFAFSTGQDTYFADMLAQPDKKILLAGRTDTDNGQRRLVVLRLLPTGLPDSSFALNGVYAGPPLPSPFYESVALRPDGRILVAGSERRQGNYDVTVVSIRADGQADPNFGENGRIHTEIGTGTDYLSEVALLPAEKILVFENNYETYSMASANPTLLRLWPDGRIDSSFAANGILRLNYPTRVFSGGRMLVQPDQKILTLNRVRSLNDSHTDFALSRFLPDGSPDPAFGDAGQLITEYSNIWNFDVGSLAVQADQKILVGGFLDSVDQHFQVLYRFNPDGSPDNSFGQNGLQKAAVLYNTFFGDRNDQLNVDPNGRITTLSVEAESWGTISHPLLLRFLPSGQLDAAFGDSGYARLSVPDHWLSPGDLVRLPDGRYLLSVYLADSTAASGQFGMMRLTSDGRPDTTYGQGGIQFLEPNIVSINPQGMAVQPDGRILASFIRIEDDSTGSRQFETLLYRLEPDGTLDNSFLPNGIVLSRSYFTARKVRLAAYDDNRVLLASTYWNGANDDLALFRVLAGTVGVADRPLSQPTMYIYPNPVLETFALQYDLEQERSVNIRLYDAQNKLIQILLAPVLRPAGAHSENLTLPAGLPAGVYVVTLEAGTGRRAVRIVVP